MAGLTTLHGLPLDCITLKGFRVDCIVGVYPSERTAPQPLEVDVSLYLDTRGAHAGGLRNTVDYARLSGELRFLLEVGRFRLLETAAQAICRYLLAPSTQGEPHAPVQAVRVQLRKPCALGGALTPSLEVYRHADEMTYGVEERDFGRVDVIFETDDCGIYRLRIAPGGCITSHHHKLMKESELMLSAGLMLQGRPVQAGTVVHWPQGTVHRYDNPQPVEQTILCVDRPRFIPTDENEVDVPLPDLRTVEYLSYYPEAAQALLKADL